MGCFWGNAIHLHYCFWAQSCCLDTGNPRKGIRELGGTWRGVVKGLSGLGWWVGSGGSQLPTVRVALLWTPGQGEVLDSSGQPFLIVLAARECCLRWAWLCWVAGVGSSSLPMFGFQRVLGDRLRSPCPGRDISCL